jgi:AraC-like DNA-binding protein
MRRLFAGELFDVSEHSCSGTPVRCREERAQFDEIVLPRRGAYIRRARTGVVFADSGSVLFFNSGEPYEIRHPLPQPDASTVFTLKPALADELRRRRGDSAVFAAGAAGASDRASCRHRLFLAVLERPDRSDSLLVEEAGVALLRLVLDSADPQRVPYDDAPSEKSARSRREVAHNAAAFLNRCFCERVLLADVAAAVGCSIFHVCRIFRAEMGHTINDHVTRLRLRAALDLVLNSGKAITDIAQDVGFSSHSHFTAAFRRRFGTTPTKLRAAPGRDPGQQETTVLIC